MSWPGIALAVLLTAALTLTACADKENIVNQLPPTSEEAVQHYDMVVEALRGSLIEVAGTGEWSPLDEAETSPGVESAAGAETVVVHSPVWVLEVSLVDEPQRSNALATVEAVATEYGFADAVTYVDEPTEFAVVLADGFGAELRFATSKTATTLRYTTGSHPVGG